MKKKNKLLLTILSLGCCASIGFGLAAPSLFAEAQMEINEAYQPLDGMIYDDFAMPTRSFTINGETKQAKTWLISPSGKAYDADSVSLNEAGIWTVRFDVSHEGKIYHHEEPFKVNKEMFEVSNGGSYYVGETERYARSGEGLIVEMPNGAKFRYNKPIDLSTLGKTDQFIKLGNIVTQPGTADINTISVILTDVYNPDVWVKMLILDRFEKENNKGATSSVRVTFSGANGHQLGYTGSTIWDNNNSFPFGRFVEHSFYGESTLGHDFLCGLSYDETDKTVHTLTDRYNQPDPTIPYSSTLVCDLGLNGYDKFYSYVYNSKPFEKAFEGFSSDKVYLTVQCEGYKAPTTKLFIKSLAGTDFSAGSIADDTPPIVDVDLGGYTEENIPLAKVGVPYAIFDCKAVDNELENIQAQKSVYYMNGEQKVMNMAVKNGTFIPTQEGTYAISYTAMDGYGNSTEKLIFVQAVKDIKKPKGVLKEGYTTEAYIGQSLQLSGVEAKAYSGMATVETELRKNGIPLTTDVENYVIQEEGKYRVVYMLTDYIGQTTEVFYDVNVIYSKNPLLFEMPKMPKCFIVGATYTLTGPIAYDYYSVKGEVKEISAQIFVDDGTGKKEMPGGLYTPQGDMNSVQVYCTYATAYGTTETVSEVPVVKINDLSQDMVNYFFTEEGVSLEKTNGGILAWFEQDSAIEFIKAIPVRESNFNMGVYETTDENGTIVYNNATRIDLYLQDTLDSAKQIKISLIKDGEKALLSVNDGARESITGNFISANAKFNFTFDNVYDCVRFDGKNISVKTFLNGEEFTGFSLDKAYLKIAVDGVDNEENFGLLLYNIGEQFLDASKDYIPPIITVDGIEDITYNLNTTVTTFTAYATDVLCENVNVTMTVYDTNYEVMTDVNGLLLNYVDASKTYEILLSSYGVYTVEYMAEDSNGGINAATVVYTVEDHTPPTLTVDKTDITCKVGDRVQLPTATFEDDYTVADNMSAYIMYYNPNGRCFLIYDNVIQNTITGIHTFDVVGEWKIIYYVFDEAYNVSITEIKVMVTAE